MSQIINKDQSKRDTQGAGAVGRVPFKFRPRALIDSFLEKLIGGHVPRKGLGPTYQRKFPKRYNSANFNFLVKHGKRVAVHDTVTGAITVFRRRDNKLMQNSKLARGPIKLNLRG